MSDKGQLLQDQPTRTYISNAIPSWAELWVRPIPQTTVSLLRTTDDLFGPVMRDFERFWPVVPCESPVLRFVYCTAADELNDLMFRPSILEDATPLLGPADPDPRQPKDIDPFDASRLVEQLIKWLGITYEQLASVTGISRSAFFHWRKTGAQPRSGNVRQLTRAHSAVSLLVRRFGVEGARGWLHSDTARWDSLLHGDIEQTENYVRAALLGQVAPHSRTIVDEVTVNVASPSERPIRRAARGVKRGRPRDS